MTWVGRRWPLIASRSHLDPESFDRSARLDAPVSTESAQIRCVGQENGWTRFEPVGVGATAEANVAQLRVVIAHDYLTQRGGAERVVLSMLRAFPSARVITSIYNPAKTFPEFGAHQIQTTWLSRVPSFRRDPRLALPFLASTWSHTVVDDADVVVCSSTGWAHGVSTSAPKIVYCHNPARWLYQTEEYLADASLPARAGLKMLRRRLRAWDSRAAHSAAKYFVNSSAVADRVSRTYGITANVLHPPAVVADGPLEPVPDVEPGFLLTVGRRRGYKNTEAIVRAVQALTDERLVVVGSLPDGDWSPRIRAVVGVSDAQLRWLYHHADALIACAYEDFGLTPIEAYTAGTPAVVLHAGGYLDTTVPGVTGEFVESPSPAEIARGIERFRSNSYSSQKIRAHAQRFSVDAFIAKLQEVVRNSYAVAA
jgi:glycosyltransferase involved in cell wall biosynthesis